MAVTQVQAAFRQVFGHWGRPERLRVDNGYPWGSKGDLPTDLALWLWGLDIGVIWNPPRQPQRNGVVERFQKVGRDWAEPETCASAAALQRRFDRLDRVQREAYPHEHGHSRLEVYPALAHSGRAYRIAWEQRHWDLRRVTERLTDFVVPRRVDAKGLVSVYNRNHYVGKKHAGQTVYVTLDPEALEWLFLSERGQQLRQRPAEEIAVRTIRQLRVSARR